MAQMHSTALEGLPKEFVAAMRTLFDIMDDKRSGYVKFSDIERRWQDDGTKGLPKGVIESLRKVTPPNGQLSFERFCAGLKICLLRNQVEQNQMKSTKHKTIESPTSQPIRPPSAPNLDAESQKNWSTANTATVRPSIISQQRTLSMPQLLIERKENTQPEVPELRKYITDSKPVISREKSTTVLYGPPKPPRTALGLERVPQNTNERNFVVDRGIDKTEIRTALQNWQLGVMMNDNEGAKSAPDKRIIYPGVDTVAIIQGSRSLGDGKPAGQGDQKNGFNKKVSSRRREPRRHTLQNGIDYNMLKRMKQIEQEQDMLMQGLQAVERARDWYLKQIAAVQDKMKYIGRIGSHLDQWTEAQQERLELQRARVLEVNRHLAALTDSWERGGLPLHMNLAVHHPGPTSHEMLSQLKQQNHLLTEEVSKKSERITALEREKASLIRELFQIRSQNRGTEEAAFM